MRLPLQMADIRETESRRDRLYHEAAASFGAALGRLAFGYENDREKCRDLVQEIHIALWRSLEAFDGRCSLRTWVYRVAHNTATSLVSRRRMNAPTLISLDEAESLADSGHRELELDKQIAH